MSWNPLKRLPLTHRPEFDSFTQSANETLEKLLIEFDKAETVTKTTYQAAKKLPDHILCAGKFEIKLTDDLSSSDIFVDDKFMTSVVEEWHSFAFATNAIGDEYVISVQKTLIEPLKQLKQKFGELRSEIRLHDSIQLDVIKFQRKVSSYGEKEKTGANVVKLQESKQALAASQKEYSRRTQLLVNDLSKFLTGSTDMLRPLLEGFIAAEMAWIRACKKTFESKALMIHETQSDRSKSIENSFKSLGSLSICSDSK